jgi:hypothetical protein
MGAWGQPWGWAELMQQWHSALSTAARLLSLYVQNNNRAAVLESAYSPNCSSCFIEAPVHCLPGMFVGDLQRLIFSCRGLAVVLCEHKGLRASLQSCYSQQLQIVITSYASLDG